MPAARTASAAARWLVVVIPPVDVAWETARWVLLAVSLCALVWVLGTGLSLFQHPHLLRDDELVAVAGQDEPVARVALWVDDPQAVVRLLRDRAVPVDR